MFSIKCFLCFMQVEMTNQFDRDAQEVASTWMLGEAQQIGSSLNEISHFV